MAAVRAAPKRQAATIGLGGDSRGAPGVGHKQLTAAQRIEAATSTRREVTITDTQAWDAEALFRKYDPERTQLLTRGALTELLKEIGLDLKLGASFPASSRLAFDSHSADAHFLTLAEFKQLYYKISSWYPTLLPRETSLNITIFSAKDLPSTDTNGKSDPFCTVMCVRTDSSGEIIERKNWSKSTTKVVEKTLNPWWGEDFTDKYGYEEGDDLFFLIWDWDKGSQSEVVGKVLLPSSEFHRPGGFMSWLPIHVLAGEVPKGATPSLKVRVAVRGMPTPPPRLHVTVHSCFNLPPADPNGKADPFCTFQIVGKPASKSQTKVCFKTLAPVWNETFSGKYRYEDGDDLIFEVRDYDGKNAKPELLGRCLLANAEFAKMGGFSGDVPLQDVYKGIVPPEHGGKAYKPLLKLTAFLLDMMPPPSDEPQAAAAPELDASQAEASGEGGSAPAPMPPPP